ncbi:MAG: 16S rRNA (guanine(527)-N(7))-methyltransferase RsmG [Negativicutes bacterium]|nr:16S rRNA (guanine(527)-N(7))-methyltransferase RsmG [Negativicutes bacterium]
MEFLQALQGALAAYGLKVTDEQCAAMNRYYELLLAWNEKMNLTAITQPQEVAVKHMVDSLSCLDPEFIPPDSALIDVGTGAGFPGLPLKIVRPDIRLTLLDSLNKRLNFLQEVTSALKLKHVDIVHGRAEETGKSKQYRERFQVATARAVARLNVLCELCLPFVAVGGYFIALKGAQYQEELGEAQNALRLLGGDVAHIRPVKLPGLDDVRAVIYIRKIAATPGEYPRRPGMPEKKPL